MFPWIWLKAILPRKQDNVNTTIIFTICLPHHFHPVCLNQAIGTTLSVPRVRTNPEARAFHFCAHSLWNNPPLSVCPASSVASFRKHRKTHFFGLAFPHNHQHPLMLWKCFIDFAVEHWFSCCTAEPGFTTNIGVKVWVIDWLAWSHDQYVINELLWN